MVQSALRRGSGFQVTSRRDRRQKNAVGLRHESASRDCAEPSPLSVITHRAAATSRGRGELLRSPRDRAKGNSTTFPSHYSHPPRGSRPGTRSDHPLAPFATLSDSNTVASTPAQPSAAGGGGGAPGTGLKLKLTLGGSTAPPAPSSVVQPAPIHADSGAYWSGSAGGMPVHDARPQHAQQPTPHYPGDDEEKRVSPDKYRKLKKKYLGAIEVSVHLRC